MKKNRYIIETGIGLQDVDKLKNSSYFIDVFVRTVKSVLKTLVDNDKLKRVNEKRYGYWKTK